MHAGILTTRHCELLGTTNSWSIKRTSGLPGFLIIETIIGDNRWRIELDLDTDSFGTLQITDQSGEIEEQRVRMEAAYYDTDRRFERPRPHGFSGVPETITFFLEGRDLTIDEHAFSGKRSVTIDLYDDSPLPQRKA